MQEELKEEGIVVSTIDGFAEVQLIENDNCDECSAKLFCKPKENDNSKSLTVQNSDGLIIGDKVTISILGKNILKASFNLYLYPLLLLVSTIFIGTKLFRTNSELYSFLLGILIITLYYLLFFQLGKKFTKVEPDILVVKSE